MFIKAYLLILSLLIIACSSGRDDFKTPSPEPDIGEELRSSEMIVLEDSGDETIVFYDKKSGAIHHLNLTQKSIIQSTKVDSPHLEHTVLGHPGGRFFIGFTTKEATIYTTVHGKISNIFSFQGTPKSARFNAASGFLVLEDSLGSIGIAKLDDTGAIINKWLGGPILDKDVTIIAGDVTDKGLLVLSFSTGKLGTVNLNTTLETQSWQYESFETDLANIDFISPLPENPDLVIIANSTEYASLNINSQSIITSVKPPNTLHWPSKTGAPHYISYEDNKGYLVSFDSNGALVKTAVFSELNMSYNFSVLYSMVWDNKISLVYEQSDQSHFIKRQINDGLALASFTLEEDIFYAIAPNFYLKAYPSTLGYAEAINIESNAVGTFKAFNLPHLN